MSMKEAFLEQERDEARREVVYAKTAMRNAIADLEDGDIDGAIETMRQIVGDTHEAAPNVSVRCQN
jgi:hypothetical protein